MIVGGFAGAALINPERSKQRMAGLQQQAAAAPARIRRTRNAG